MNYFKNLLEQNRNLEEILELVCSIVIFHSHGT